uniref:Uncharacterized protein n=1 Tax=Triticum urartu TaxID=4572 RepID=A0A8R7V5V6_TRIUA
MAAWTSVGLVAVAVLVVGIAMPASAAVQPPAPAPSSDGEKTPAPHPLFSLSLSISSGLRLPALAGAWAPCHPLSPLRRNPLSAAILISFPVTPLVAIIESIRYS